MASLAASEEIRARFPEEVHSMEEKIARFAGCMTATITAFDAADRLDRDRIGSHAQWLLNRRITGLCPVGTTGEFLFLSEEEKRATVRATVDAAGAAPVIAGIWALREAETIRLAVAAEQ